MNEGPPEKEPIKEFQFNVTCELCKQSFKLEISDTNRLDALANAVQTALFIHQCPNGTPKPYNFTISEQK